MGENRRVVDVGCGELGRNCVRRNDGGVRQQTLQRGVPPDQRIDSQHCGLPHAARRLIGCRARALRFSGAKYSASDSAAACD